jgi:CRP-like cAMP-binding protein
VLSKQGKEATIALLGPDDFLGEGCIASDQPIRLATATAITSCTVLKIHKKEMLRALHAEQLFSDMFVAYMVERRNRRVTGQVAYWYVQCPVRTTAAGSNPSPLRYRTLAD